eukprot:gene14784-16422_t
MITIQTLPEHVILYLLSYVEDRDRAFLTASNRSIHKQLMKKYVKLVTLGYQDAVDLLTNPEFANDICNQIDDPYRQLNCFFPAHYKPSLGNITPINSFKTLECSYEVLSCNFLPKIQKVETLVLCKPGRLVKPLDYSLTNDQIFELIETIAEKNRREHENTNLSLKSLSLNDYSSTPILPFIPNLTSLEVMNSSIVSIHTNYCHLHKAIFVNCVSLVDVSPLSQIYDLSIFSCSNLVDISKLTNNHSVTIVSCHRIMDYSAGFQFTHKIEISYPNVEAQIELTSLMKNIFSFSVTATAGSRLQSRPILTNGYSPPTLRHLAISSDYYNHIYGGIKRLQISNCGQVHILTMLNNLRVLTLTHCKISSLKGLVSTSTRIVTLDHCDAIKDFSYLKYVSKVSILDCAGFENVEEVDHVRHLVLRAFDKEMRLGSLGVLGEHVEHLELRGKIEIEGGGLIGLENVPVIEIAGMNIIKNTRLHGLGGNMKIVLRLNYGERMDDIFELVEDLQSKAHYIRSPLSELEVVLLKGV